MTTQELTKYLEAVFDIELNIYIQENIIQEMNNKANTLGNRKSISAPSQRESDTDIFEVMFLVGIATGVISAIIAALIEFFSTSGLIMPFINAIIGAALYGVIGLLAGGLVLGTIIGLIMRRGDNKKISLFTKKNLMNIVMR